MDVTTLKQRAAQQEREGDLAAAIATYREILDQLADSPAMKRELPLVAKLGDLLSQTGDKTAAVSMYERAAQLYMEHGSAKSISVLCLKVLQADHSQTDVYFRFARGLLDHGHVDAARAVLVEYAKRAKLAKTLTRLEALAGQPEHEVRHHLEQLFVKVEERARPPSPTPAPVESPVEVAEPEDEALEARAREEELEEDAELEREEIVEEEKEDEEEVRERPKLEVPPSIITSDITLPSEEEERAEPVVALPPPDIGEEAEAEKESAVEPEDEVIMPSPVGAASFETEPIAAEPAEASVGAGSLISEPEAEEPSAPATEPAVADKTTAEPPGEPVAGVRAARARRRDMLFSGLGYRAEKSRPAWLWPTVAAVVVVTGASGAAILLSGNGSESAAGAEGTGAVGTVQESLPAATERGTALDDTGAVDSLGVPLAAADSVVLEAGALGTGPTPIGDAVPAGGDQSILVATDTTGQMGRPPAVAPADTGLRQPPRIITAPVRADRVLVVEGLQIESVEDLPSGTGGYRIVQVLASGEGLALTVVPIDRAGPIVGGGALRVSPLRGDSAIGTVRFGNDMVTARASVGPSVLEGLLRQLVEIERP